MISGACSPPSPSSPWQVAHFASKIFFPSTAGFAAEVGASLFGFWQKMLLAAPQEISTNPKTIRQVPLRENSFVEIGDIGR
jgi:hypothetical protein